MTKFVFQPGLKTTFFNFFIIGCLCGFTPAVNDSTQPEVDEELVVVKGHQLAFDVKEGALQTQKLFLSQQPEFGRVTNDGDGTLMYAPNKGVCEEKDYFSYVIETEKGQETVKVAVEIICETLTVINGFSPDGDGVNDNFTILGIQNFPNNSLKIFNKWGETVFKQKGYENNWNGERLDGDSAASNDNVYYYVLDNGEGELLSGYVQITDNI